jgi:hypothetical protein
VKVLKNENFKLPRKKLKRKQTNITKSRKNLKTRRAESTIVVNQQEQASIVRFD